MNERIKELAEQCYYRYSDNIDLEKFAELIVRECIAQCEKNAEHEYLGTGSKLSAFNIREHFGIEE
jgi:hypothetical protein